MRFLSVNGCRCYRNNRDKLPKGGLEEFSKMIVDSNLQLPIQSFLSIIGKQILNLPEDQCFEYLRELGYWDEDGATEKSIMKDIFVYNFYMKNFENGSKLTIKVVMVTGWGIIYLTSELNKLKIRDEKLLK